ncbi:MAG: hypothetical protein KAY37_04025 [Phycisphaerae bacterium]|nr:hypothetical protein [Phycisphaerae bacterium]
MIGWSGLLIMIVWGLHHLDQRVVAAQSGAQCRLEWVELPLWLQTSDNDWVLRGDERHLYTGIEAVANLQPDDDPHDPELCSRVGTGLLTSPWVDTVERVSKHITNQGDAVIRVRATFREPLAFVEAYGRAYLVDEKGVRLPADYPANALGPTDFFMIIGVSTPVPEVGEQWVGEDLAAGLKLVRYLRTSESQGRLSFRSLLRAVDIGNFHGRECALDAKLRLRLFADGYINWGEPPGEEDSVEPSAKRKLEMLTAIYSARGELPENMIELRDPDPEGRELLLGPEAGEGD